jgi:hypothetical protein
MPLLDEGVPVIRPVNAGILGKGIYRVLPLENSSTETWKFPPGSNVRCHEEVWDDKKLLVAYEIVE